MCAWGTEFKAEHYISRRHFDSKEDVQDAIDDCESDMVRYKNEMMIWAAGNPSELIQLNEEDNDRAFEIRRNIDDLFDAIENVIIERQELEWLSENFNKAEKV